MQNTRYTDTDWGRERKIHREWDREGSCRSGWATLLVVMVQSGHNFNFYERTKKSTKAAQKRRVSWPRRTFCNFSFPALINDALHKSFAKLIASLNCKLISTQEELEQADAFLVVYSCIDKESFTRAKHILSRLQDMDLLRHRPTILVANKIDLARSRAVSAQGKSKHCLTGAHHVLNTLYFLIRWQMSCLHLWRQVHWSVRGHQP